MAKKIKTPNQFAAPSDGVQADSPVETPAPTVRVKRDGTPFKVSGPSGLWTVNPKVQEFKKNQQDAVQEFRKNQQDALAAFVTDQKGSRAFFMRDLRVESEAAKMAARLEKKLLDMTPAEKAWMAKATANQLAKDSAQELEQHP